MSTIEDRLRRIEKLLELVLTRLEELERALHSQGHETMETLRIARELTLGFSMPTIKALEAASKVIKLLPKVDKRDEVAKAIVKILSTGEELTLSELTRRVRALRGKASRRIVSERVKKLERRGIVLMRRRGSRVYVKLRSLEEAE